MLESASIVLILVTIFSYINARYLKMVQGIGIMLVSLMLSILLVGLDQLSLLPESFLLKISSFISYLDFNYLLMDGMLGALLFAAALHVDINDLKKQKYTVAILSSVGLLISTFLIAGMIYYTSGLLGIQLPFIYSLIFGAIISPTDPIAVLSIFKTVGASKELETKIAGESLFNDGFAVVFFIIVVGIATGDKELSFATVGGLFVQEAVGGLILGLALGYVSYLMLKHIDDYDTEVLITVSLVFAIYLVSHQLHVSSPVASVVAGLLIGNRGRNLAMSKKTTQHLDNFWHLVDEILNSVLFTLLGLELIMININGNTSMLGLFAIMIVLFSRFTGVGVLINLLKYKFEFSKNTIKTLTWAGMRGGISVALALSLPESEYKEVILTITYIVVVFSILVQGLSLSRFMKKFPE